jgi:hypothetical protein
MVYRFYAEQGIITEPGEYGDKLQDLPRDISALVKVVQGLLIHVFWAERYGLNLPEERKQEVQLRKVRLQLQRIFQLDERPLETPRPMEKRLAGNCRDFATLLCSFLRSQGIPARARCGFGAYFRPGTYEDHWVCEYWHAEQKRWVLVDAQLDDLQRDVLGIRFDALDVPRNEFIVGGKAWHWCRQGEADPNDFGIFDMRGLGFIRGDFVRDIAALNKVELLPWDCWGLADCPDSELTEADLELLDRCAPLTMKADVDETRVGELYLDPRLKVPAKIKSYIQAGIQEIEL